MFCFRLASSKNFWKVLVIVIPFSPFKETIQITFLKISIKLHILKKYSITLKIALLNLLINCKICTTDFVYRKWVYFSFSAFRYFFCNSSTNHFDITLLLTRRTEDYFVNHFWIKKYVKHWSKTSLMPSYFGLNALSRDNLS